MAQPIWSTPVGLLGTYPSFVYLEIQVIAAPVMPATSVTYTLLSGSLPAGLSISTDGWIYGSPSLVTVSTSTSFTIRATDDLNNIRDRTFYVVISGSAMPQITTPDGSLLSTVDSIWIETQITYSNPDPSNLVIIAVTEGVLPPGLELNEQGIIRGYPQPPVYNVLLSQVETIVTATSSSTNLITCYNTDQFLIGRPVVFTGTTFGTIVSGTTYYIKTIDSITTFSISTTENGYILLLTDDAGLMTATLPDTTVGEPIKRTYSFALKLISNLGSDIGYYTIDITNQHTPVSKGGPGKNANTRTPTILNTRPLTFLLTDSDPYYGYYILPPVAPSQDASIGTIQSDNYFAFRVIGYDFDGNNLTYSYSGLPPGLVGDPVTGWITGAPTLSSTGINRYSFSVGVYKTDFPSLYSSSDYFNFTYDLSFDITGQVTWITDSNLGSVFNGAISYLNVRASSDVNLSYRLLSGSLPPNLTLASNGEIQGRVVDQPTEEMLLVNDTTSFTFQVEAYSPSFSIISSSRTFNLTVLQKFQQPTDILYCKATPSVPDRLILGSLLADSTLIPNTYLYRPDDIYFGKATNVTYDHMYGVYASDIAEYLAAVSKNHFRRSITLGELKTAIAKNATGDIIYEAVYSQVIDNIQNNEISGTTTGENDDDPSYIVWNTPINLGLGPWYTSVTDIYTSYEEVLNQLYYTSLTPGYVNTLYTNSLLDMRNRIATAIGQEYNSELLPLWMTSQQANGGTLGYTAAWVLCYTLPRIIVNGNALTYVEFKATGLNRADYYSYAETIKNNIQTSSGKPPVSSPWQHTLNEINFSLDRFTVDKSETYDYASTMSPPAWLNLPSATPTPNPIDSKDFYVLFPRQTILPTNLE